MYESINEFRALNSFLPRAETRELRVEPRREPIHVRTEWSLTEDFCLENPWIQLNFQVEKPFFISFEPSGILIRDVCCGCDVGSGEERVVFFE
jgi:hypothetical protein